jgi:hypothetical protein
LLKNSQIPYAQLGLLFHGSFTPVDVFFNLALMQLLQDHLIAFLQSFPLMESRFIWPKSARTKIQPWNPHEAPVVLVTA